MRQFLKYFFASVLGSMVGLVMAFFLFVLILVSISAGLVSKAKDQTVEVKPNSILNVRLDFDIKERTAKNPFDEIEIPSFEAKRSLGLNDLLAGIKNAKEDDNIKGIYLDLNIIAAGMATVEAIRKALLDFKTSGKFVLAYGELVTQKAYYLASVADEIYINPVGYLDFRGLAAELAFFKNALEKLEIEAQVVYAGKYKSATEPFRLDQMSDANREQITSIISGVYGHFLEKISESRNISTAVLDSIASNMTITDVDDAVSSKMIDGVAYFDEILTKLKTKVNIEDDDELNWIDITKYSIGKNAINAIKAKDKIAVLYAEGNIVDGKGAEDNIGSERYAKAIRKIRNDKDVKALVFRINSGGGSALASDVILREIKLANEKMPVIVSMGDVAASGGYYIACAADTILAEPNTITGSIGVFGLLPNMQGFFNNKLGITFDGVKTGKFSDFGNMSRPLTAEEKTIIQVAIDSIYMTFKQRVASGRGISVDYVDSIAQGRVWTGIQAKKLGLVDLIGGLEDAIKIATATAGIENYEVQEYPELKDPLEKLLEELSLSAQTFVVKQKLGEYYPIWTKIDEFKDMWGVQARMPFAVEIY